MNARWDSWVAKREGDDGREQETVQDMDNGEDLEHSFLMGMDRIHSEPAGGKTALIPLNRSYKQATILTAYLAQWPIDGLSAATMLFCCGL
jgi:hypothetical protein